MHKFSTVILLLFVAVFAVSAGKKDFPKAEIKVSYTYPHLALKTDGKAYESEYPMILLTNGSYSKFYNPRTEFNDSLHSTPSGRKVYHQLMSEGVRRYVETRDESLLPVSPASIYVFKSSSDSTTTVYDRGGLGEYGFYSEPRGGMEWEIGDSTKNILGYECVIATSEFRGRRWTVWFTPDIPIDNGPWKLCGLPGLILEASESSGQHSFIADGIELSKAEIRPIYLPKQYRRMSRKDLLQARRAYLLNGDVMTRQLIQDTPSGSKIEMEPLKTDTEKDYHVDFLETDYHE